jgi:HSP20 family protein
MLIRPSSPFGELLSLRRAMERMFDDPFFRPVLAHRTVREMPLDVLETGESLVIEAALPGIKPEEVDVSVVGDVLTVTAGSESETSGDENGYRVREVRRGRVTRSVTLPQGLQADQATASFENGLLRLSIPKAQKADKVHIPVTTAVQGEATRIEATTGSPGSGDTQEGATPSAEPPAS